MCEHICIYIYRERESYICTNRKSTRASGGSFPASRRYARCVGTTSPSKSLSSGSPNGLYTILPSPTLYGVWHKKEGVYCTMVMQ